MAEETNFFRRIQDQDETVEEYLTMLRTIVDYCNLPPGLLVRLLTPQLVEGCAQKKVQQGLLSMMESLLDESSPSCEPTKPRGRKATR